MVVGWIHGGRWGPWWFAEALVVRAMAGKQRDWRQLICQPYLVARHGRQADVRGEERQPADWRRQPVCSPPCFHPEGASHHPASAQRASSDASFLQPRHSSGPFSGVEGEVDCRGWIRALNVKTFLCSIPENFSSGPTTWSLFLFAKTTAAPATHSVRMRTANQRVAPLLAFGREPTHQLSFKLRTPRPDSSECSLAAADGDVLQELALL